MQDVMTVETLLRAGLLRWLAAVLLLALALSARADVRLSDSEPDVDLWPQVRLLVDGTRTLTAEQAVLRDAEFRRPTGPRANLGIEHRPVWFRVTIQPEREGDGRWILDIDYPALDRIDVYLVTDGRPVLRGTLGDRQTGSVRALATRSPALPLVLEREVAVELLVRVETTSSMIVPLRLVKAEAFHASEARLQMAQGLAAGIGLCLLMYALSQWAATRDPMFFYYGVVITGTGLFFFGLYGLGAQYLWPHSPWLVDASTPLTVLVALAGGMLLINRMLDVRALQPRAADAGVAVAVLASATALALALGVVGYPVAQFVATALGLAPMLLAVPAAWIRWREGDAAAAYVFAGWAVYAVGVGVMALLLRGVLPSNTFTQHAFQAATLFEMLMWLRVLALRNAQTRAAAERAERERRAMQRLAHTDALTGLPNRRGLEIALAEALPAATPERLLALYVGDLDGFKAVNDRLGHDAGDDLLQAVSQRLGRQLRAHDLVARTGGDEFVILARDLASEAAAWQVGHKLVEAFRQPFVVRGESCRVGLTLGFALAPADGREGVDLLRRADAAMYAGKQGGKSTVRRGGTVSLAC